MLNIQLNGEARQVDSAQDLASLVQAQGVKQTQVALVLNGELVPRHRWPHIHIQDNDNLELFSAVAGG
ncbi:sulfur carrier protein ThiS [Shewanella sp. JM162201]|uniref:Sulfur carrier protein ThiS n=1 Tax=Shewanella jiangmenensis TaxID=2837387 RepID=A0ABS5V6A6_9GAMM|nr:sulfur carrier protein ThiS [Shewanella jiangmenensis]MBT1445977.1 sulfur carrier protein ThiS [Shewanella jiangmenensis]